jgi:hypothetical protein
LARNQVVTWSGGRVVWCSGGQMVRCSGAQVLRWSVEYEDLDSLHEEVGKGGGGGWLEDLTRHADIRVDIRHTPVLQLHLLQ